MVRSPSSGDTVARGRDRTGQEQGLLRMGQGMSRGPSVDMACLGVPEGKHKGVFRGSQGRGTCPRVPEVDTRHFQGYPTIGTGHIQGRDGLGEAHSRGGCAWLPGTVGHGHSRRDLEQKPAKVRGSCLTPRWEPQAGPRGGPGAGGGSRGGEDLGREAPRSFVARSSPGGRAPQPPPRAGPDFPALFTSEKTFPGPGMLRRSNQAPAPAPPTC